MSLRTLVIGGPATYNIFSSTTLTHIPDGAYYARQSLAGLATPPKHSLPLSNISTQFRRTLVNADAQRVILRSIEADQWDLILLDATEERFALAQFTDGAILTISPEFTEMLPLTEPYQIIKPGTDQHFELWRTGWRTLTETLNRTGNMKKLRLHKALLSQSDEQYQELSSSQSSAQVNAYLGKIYDTMLQDLRAEGFDQRAIIETPDPRVPKDGTNPLYYGNASSTSVFRKLATSIDAVSNERPPANVLDRIRFARQSHINLNFRASPPLFALPQSTAEPGDCPQGDQERTYIVPLQLDKTIRDGFAIRYRLSGWRQISALAIRVVTPEGPRRLTYKHAAQDRWITEVVGLNDPLFLMSNRWESTPSTPIGHLAIETRGIFAGDPKVEVAWVATFTDLEGRDPDADRSQLGWVEDPDVIQSLRDELTRYVRKMNSFAPQQAEIFLKTGRYPVYGETESVDWSYKSSSPFDAGSVNTYRNMYHSMNLVASLMVLGSDSSSLNTFGAAQVQVYDWVRENLHSRTNDPMYAWYDHATPMRVLALALCWLTMKSTNLEDKRFETTLKRTLVHHGEMLASQAFYARNQPVSSHNHAWFQDIGLLVLSAMLPSSDTAREWGNTARSRISKLFKDLIIEDGDCSIWAENSYGYHLGQISLIEFTLGLMDLAGIRSDRKVLERMERWLELVRYPDDAYPAFGDTFPYLRPRKYFRSVKYNVAHDWPAAGYASIRLENEEHKAQLSFISSSATSIHKHSDALSFTLWIDGIEWFTDPGLISYNPDDLASNYARSSWAHNAISIASSSQATDAGLTSAELSQTDFGWKWTGSTRAWAGYEYHRSIEACSGSLAISGEEQLFRRTPETPSSSIEATLVFHLGRAVYVSEACPGQVVVRHANSTTSLVLTLPSDCEPSIIVGLGDTIENTSVISSGLTMWESTQSICAPWDFSKAPMTWSVTVDPN